MKKIAFVCFLSLILISCGDKYFTLDAEELVLPESFVEIDHEPLDLNIMGSNDLIIYDTLMFVITSNPDGHLYVFSTNTKRLLMQLCKQGRASNEFMQPFFSAKQILVNNSSILLPLVNNATQLKVVNISESLKTGNTIVEYTEPHPFVSDANVLIGDSEGDRLIAWNPRSDNPFEGPIHAPKIEYKNKDKVLKTYRFFPKLMETEQDFEVLNLCAWTTRKQPEGDLIVQTFYRMGYLLITNYKTGESKAIHIAGTPTFDDYISKDNLPGRYFGDVVVTKDRIIAIYLGGSSIRESIVPQHILIFDLDGNLLSSAFLGKDVAIHSIAYDENTKTLYATDIMKDTMCTFDISKLMTSNDSAD